MAFSGAKPHNDPVIATVVRLPRGFSPWREVFLTHFLLRDSANFGEIGQDNQPHPKNGFFPPLTLMPCDSGRDNQLRVKSPPMIVIILNGWFAETPNKILESKLSPL